MTDANYADLLATRDEWILDFYATWCGACQQFAPKLKLLSERLADADMPHVGIAKIEIDANPELAARFMITRLPTLFYLRHNESKYPSPATLSGLDSMPTTLATAQLKQPPTLCHIARLVTY
ncbi:thioredoxin-like protein [Dimargaris cristalligena]|uniref:Thioredoxin-like protein n=1 Tax=Dimargaris cristalligena TaxID=215637 RepID=A0A4P9ZR82_9FUNG|nr:thioredoxin-like protein [Dimargaris cristalligena]|eukprot:RKP34940.1 thioredoxin-like protein [Dimargaris cristalligena]